MKRHTLASDGSWAMLREAHELTEGGQRGIRRAIARVSRPTRDALQHNEEVNDRNGKLPKGAPREPLVEIPFTPEDLDALDDANDACVLALVTSWSFDADITLDGMQKLTARDYRKLQELCAPAVKAANVDFSPALEGSQETPFGNSSVSNGPSEAGSSLVSFPQSSASID